MKYKGFTIVPDFIVQRYGAIGGVIFGKIARYCDWSPMGICTASNQRLADELQIGESTVRKYKKILSDDGIIKMTGQMGVTNTVAIVHEIVMEMDSALLGSDPPATSELPPAEVTPLLDSDKEVKSIKDKASAEAVAWKAGVPVAPDIHYHELDDYPVDVADKLKVLMIYYPHLEIPEKPNTGNWIKQVHEHLDKRSIKDLHAMCKFTKKQGWAVVQPSSISKAYVGMQSAKQTTIEDTLKEQRFGNK